MRIDRSARPTPLTNAERIRARVAEERARKAQASRDRLNYAGGFLGGVVLLGVVAAIVVRYFA